MAGIVELDGNIVLIRNRGWPENIYGLVSGFLEKGETPDTAILREVKEELDLRGEILQFIGYYSFFRMNQLILAYHIKANGTITIGEELADIRIVQPDRLRPWDFGTGPAVRDWLESKKIASAEKHE